MSDSENNGDAEVRRSSRRCGVSAKTIKTQSAIERLKEARASGRAHRPDLEVEDVYDTVDDAEYEKIVSKRQNDNFVVDDDGMGYVDTGVDFEDDEYEDYEDDQPTVSSSRKDTKGKKEKKEKRKKGAMDSYLSYSSSKKQVVDESKVKASMDDDDDLNNILESLKDDDGGEDDYSAHRSAPINPFKRGRSVESPGSDSLAPRPIAKKPKTLANVTGLAAHRSQNKTTPRKKTPEIDQDDDDYGIPDIEDPVIASPIKNEVISPVVTSKKESTQLEMKEESLKMEVDFEEKSGHMTEVENNFSQFRVAEEEWTGSQDDENDENEKIEVKTGTEPFYVSKGDGEDVKAIRMYWFDAYEDAHKSNGTVYLFGKVKTSETTWEACSIVAKNICRKVYFMPRSENLRTGEKSSLTDLHKEIGDVLKHKFNTHEFKCKMVEKGLIRDESFGSARGTKTAFMEVLYPAEKGKLPSDLSGDTFSHTFNTSVNPLERLLIEKKFKGPGWIELYNYSDPKAKTTNCKYEFEVDMDKMKNIKYLEGEDLEKIKLSSTVPSVKLLALKIVTTLNEKKEQEICMISTLVNSECNLNHPSAKQKDFKPRCLVTKPYGGSLPYDIQKRLEGNKLSKLVKTVPNEKALLTLFLAEINDEEPDIIVGHDLPGMISLLVSRLDKLKLPNWSRISRLKRSINIGKIGHSRTGQLSLTAGRMMLDSKESAMELQPKSRTFDLTELSHKILNITRHEIYPSDISHRYSDSKDLINLIKWVWDDLLLPIRIVVSLNALPLYIQVSQIVGGLASRVMAGGRSERNEYLLLHAFEKADLIAPDKFNAFENKKKKEQQTGEDGVEEKKTGKAQYSGGLVLEPKKGLYETLILLLDFNSLYPSIIQEYNICYTTLEYAKDSDEQLTVPQNTADEGLLPREVRNLVERRRDVRALMKNENNESKKNQMDIRQQALKLTANSMYGCLGFQSSRFYAKPLAALITAKGREVLMHSKDLVEKMGYSVVYGDTDSIMINTNLDDLVEAKRLGSEIKKTVNNCHRLLELGLDGVFKRMLLLKKKKYAALKIDVDTKIECTELKGLDIVRRDWSQLAKGIGEEVVHKILDPSLTREVMVASIDDLLKNVRQSLDAGEVPLEKFQISKQLTRNPDQYSDVKAQSHAAVAQRLNKSGKFNLRHNDIVEYVICEDGTENAATQRAYHLTEMLDNKSLKIDLSYYLAHQIHPVVSRLIEPIEEIDAVRIAEDLGLDSTSYRRAAAAQASQKAAEEDCTWQQENYELCEGVVIICPYPECGHSNIIRETFDCVTDPTSPRFVIAGCLKCEGSWESAEHQAVIFNQIDRQLGEFVSRHHLAAYKCDEPTCEFKTRTQTMKWCREGLECIRCSTGVLRREYTSRQLFDQQMFFRQIFDVEAAIRKMSDSQKRAAENRNRQQFTACRIDAMEIVTQINKKYLERNSYNRVDLSYIFAPMVKI